MANTLQKMSDDEMQALAEKLVGMKINKARGYLRRQDPEAAMEMLRVGVGHELLTRYRLPSLGISVTLVEMDQQTVFELEDVIEDFQKRGKFEPQFVEARVVPLA